VDRPVGGGHDPGGDGAWAHRPLPARAGPAAGRGVPRGHLELPARMGARAQAGTAHGAHRRRGVGGTGLRAAGGLRELRRPAPVLAGRLGAGPRGPGEGRSGRAPPAHAAPRRPGAERPLERRDRARGVSSTCSSSGPGRRACPPPYTAPRRG
jgi:hypothetical protein